MVPRSGVKNMGGKGEKTTSSLNRDNRAIRERHNGAIIRERNLEGSVGIPGIPTVEETTYIATGFGEEIMNIKAVVELDTNRGIRGVVKDEMDGTFTNSICTEPVDQSSGDRAEICEIREVGGHVGCSTSVKDPHITKGEEANESGVVEGGRRDNIHKPFADVGLNGLSKKSRADIIKNDVKRVAHGDNTNGGGGSCPNRGEGASPGRG
jgi:hypothetical protein